MPPKPPRRRNWRSLTLLGLTWLTACSPQPVDGVTYCPAAIHSDAEARAWLRTLTPPPPAVHYFSQLAHQQALFDRGCR